MIKPAHTIIFLILSVCFSNAQTNYFNSGGIAINGYDPVAYFSENAAAAGSKQFNYSWQGAVWHFKNQANLDLFKTSPEKYAPQFGGFCAYGASENHKAPTEPAAFTIVNDKLYLNYSSKVRELWLQDTKGRIEKAEMHWVTLRDKKD